jgi:hypothetical protein
MAWREDSDLEFNCISRGIPIKKVKNARVEHPVRPVDWGHSVKDEKKGMYNVLLYRKFPDLYEQKIGSRPPAIYYGIITCTGIFLFGLAIQNTVTAFVGSAGWLVLVITFTIKRLRGKSRRFRHILEMLATSAVIPFFSVWWYGYGCIKFKKAVIHGPEN